jgi:tetratricopeptide (TPR) repeat protein
MSGDAKLDLGQIDILIRQGRGAEARALLLQAKPQGMSLRALCQFAALCRRVSLYQEGLSALRRAFFEERDKAKPDAELMAEYAALLSEIGATAISGKIFARLEPLHGHAPLYAALRHMKNWDYGAALKALESFSNPDSYWRDIAAINRLACLILLKDFAGAERLIGELKSRSSDLTAFVAGSLLELEGQLLYFQNRIDQAFKHFTSAFEHLKNTSNPVALYAEKWIHICRLRDPSDKTIEAEVLVFQKRARELGQWEVARDLERHLALRLQDAQLMSRVYFGSPHLNYRELLLRDSGFTPAREYVHRVGDADAEPAGTLRLAQMEFVTEARRFTRFPALAKRLLSSLLRDLYRPVAIGTLFEYLFPDEYFDPDYSPAKTHKVIHRFRELCEKQGIPLRVEATSLGFQLTAEGAVLIEYSQGADYRRRETPADNLIHMIASEFDGLQFTAKELAERTGVSLSSINRRIKELLAQGELEARGAGRARTYVKAKKAA